MKILITTDLYTVKTNGVVTSITNLTEELQLKEHDVKILSRHCSAPIVHTYHTLYEDYVGYLRVPAANKSTHQSRKARKREKYRRAADRYVLGN